jgi:hypothetical protein
MKNEELGLFTPQNRTAYAPGETLEISALWALPEKPASLEARLFWFTRGKGTEDVGVVNTEAMPNPEAAGEHTLRFVLPDNPWSFSGKLVSLIWAVELVAQPGGKSVRCEFTVAPGGKEIQLHAHPDAART